MKPDAAQKEELEAVAGKNQASHSLSSDSHTPTITCTCCHDVINRIHDLKISYHAESLIHSDRKLVQIMTNILSDRPAYALV